MTNEEKARLEKHLEQIKKSRAVTPATKNFGDKLIEALKSK